MKPCFCDISSWSLMSISTPCGRLLLHNWIHEAFWLRFVRQNERIIFWFGSEPNTYKLRKFDQMETCFLWPKNMWGCTSKQIVRVGQRVCQRSEVPAEGRQKSRVLVLTRACSSESVGAVLRWIVIWNNTICAAGLIWSQRACETDGRAAMETVSSSAVPVWLFVIIWEHNLQTCGLNDASSSVSVPF